MSLPTVKRIAANRVFWMAVLLVGWLLPIAAEEPQQKKLPPLIVDTDTPLLLDSDSKAPMDLADVSPSVAANADCYVCHENYSEELLVQWHAAEGIGCIDCHGKSFAHKNDENNTTPPDVMFPLDKIDASCEECHEIHDVPAMDVVTRLQQQVPRARAGDPVVCTQCHGSHRLAHRTVVWDRATRALLTGSDQSPGVVARPGLEVLRQLAGAWVAVDDTGAPTGNVVAEYRVTAAGSAVVEVLFPGAEHEMMTVYHQDGEDLFLTHYCAAQNQPRMKCIPGTDPNVLAFTFVDATNMRSLDERHMHAVTLKIMGPDRLQAQWQSYLQGKPEEPVVFDLMREEIARLVKP